VKCGQWIFNYSQFIGLKLFLFYSNYDINLFLQLYLKEFIFGILV